MKRKMIRERKGEDEGKDEDDLNDEGNEVGMISFCQTATLQVLEILEVDNNECMRQKCNVLMHHISFWCMENYTF